jgi:hypothetical protein
MMKGNKLIHNWVILLLTGLSLCCLGIGYAVRADADPVKENIPSTPSFIFSRENDEDFKLKLVYNQAREKAASGAPLEAYMDYDNKTLRISGAEAFDLTDFIHGSVSLAIDYRMTKDRHRQNTSQVTPGVYDLGNVPLFLTREDPYWRIVNKGGAWGIGLPDIGIPESIYQLIPENISGLLGYNTITSYKKGVLKGTVSFGNYSLRGNLVPKGEAMSQENLNSLENDLQNSDKTPEINLSSLELPEKLNQEILSSGQKASILEIVANYYFSVPIGLDHKTSDDIRNPSSAAAYDILTGQPQIQGKITLRTLVKVVHDIEKTDLGEKGFTNYGH